jgi:hypothetical protein
LPVEPVSALWSQERKAQPSEQEEPGYTHLIVALRNGSLEDAHARRALCSAEQRWVLVWALRLAESVQQP